MYRIEANMRCGDEIVTWYLKSDDGLWTRGIDNAKRFPSYDEAAIVASSPPIAAYVPAVVTVR